MDGTLVARWGALAFAVLIALGAAQGAEADIFIGGTDDWTMVGAPSVQIINGSNMGVVSYSNHLAVAVTAIVIMVLRNDLNQTVYFSTSTLTLSGGPTGTIGPAYIVEFGLAPGVYNATFFAFTFGGVAISAPTNSAFAVSR
jgi:hypothetical protein